MDKQFTDAANKVMVLAEQEARGLGHGYVGTEHILLGILGEGSGVAMGAIMTLHADAAKLREEIEKLVQRGPDSGGLPSLPRTPRAKRAIELGRDVAKNLGQKVIGPEHLLIGLAREEKGVAGTVLRSLGITEEKIGREVFRIRLEQFKTVERAVRPVRAGTSVKRKMRRELMGHLEAIYEQEFSRLGEATAAIKEAARRLGEPNELAHDLQSSVTFMQRMNYYVERWTGWHPPETGAKYAARMAVQIFGIMALFIGLLLAGGWRMGLNLGAVWIALRPLVAISILAPVDSFLILILYFTLRDSLCGALWTRRSRAKVIWMEVLIVLVILGSRFAVGGFNLDLLHSMDWLYLTALCAVGVALWCLYVAHAFGPMEIRDTLWACLNLQDE
jgi:hypothetical protein